MIRFAIQFLKITRTYLKHHEIFQLVHTRAHASSASYFQLLTLRTGNS